MTIDFSHLLNLECLVTIDLSHLSHLLNLECDDYWPQSSAECGVFDDYWPQSSADSECLVTIDLKSSAESGVWWLLTSVICWIWSVMTIDLSHLLNVECLMTIDLSHLLNLECLVTIDISQLLNLEWGTIDLSHLLNLECLVTIDYWLQSPAESGIFCDYWFQWFVRNQECLATIHFI